MMMRNLYYSLVFICCLVHGTLHGQNVLTSSLTAGYTYSSISNLETTILSEPNFLNYTLNRKPRSGWTTGIGFDFKEENQPFGFQFVLNYAQQGSDLVFDNYEKDLKYNMQFKYQYLNLGCQVKFYPFPNRPGYEYGWEGLFIGAGPQLGFNLAASNIVYTSSGAGVSPNFGTDLQQQQQLRNVLKGKTNFGFNFILGYEFRNPAISLTAGYFYGLSDVMETQANSFNFIENKNTNTAFQFIVGWKFFSNKAD